MSSLRPMGLGNLGSTMFEPHNYTAPGYEHLKTSGGRKFRWTFEGTFPVGSIKPTFVKVGKRPEMIEETELNYLSQSQKTWIPGKSKYDTTTVSMFDMAEDSEYYKDVMRVLQDHYSKAVLNEAKDFAIPDEVRGEVILKLWDGCGNLLETWKISKAAFIQVNFGDYSGNPATDMELTIQYEDVKYENSCLPPPKNIYGFKTPERHKEVFTDGEPHESKWKRVEIMSSCGSDWVFKDEGKELPPWNTNIDEKGIDLPKEEPKGLKGECKTNPLAMTLPINIVPTLPWDTSLLTELNGKMDELLKLLRPKTTVDDGVGAVSESQATGSGKDHPSP